MHQEQVHADTAYLGLTFLFCWFPMGHTAARDITARVLNSNLLLWKNLEPWPTHFSVRKCS